MFVKIVHQGGRVEIHDRPILAAELLSRNPKCCVAHPDVFHQPYAVVSPSTTLALGKKYYVVPVCTIARLQLKHSSSQPNDQKRNGRTRLPLAHADHWQPGLESIME
ncbi:hypothetical protein AAHA92_19192 [Salvia divinorum]|uniref:Uncharacterized protein n=1 Tax=Salvia divinorum TaxID=28513 RepID=A0ABD1H7T7_SALDI